MNSNHKPCLFTPRALVVYLVLTPLLSFAAEIYARKMAILRNASGQATVFKDSVVIKDSTTELFSRQALLNEKENIALLTDSVLIFTPEAMISADSVVYDFAAKKALLLARPLKEVVVKQESLEIYAREIEFFPSTRMVSAPLGLKIKNVSGNYEITGSRGYYDLNSQIGVVDSEPVLIIRKTERDSVLVTAQRFSYFQKQPMARAEGQVCLHSGESDLCADTVIFFPGADSGVAWGAPVVKDTNSKAKGDSLFFHLTNGAVKKVTLCGKAEGSYRTETGETVEVQGKSIALILTEGAIERIEVRDLILGKLVRASPASGQMSSEFDVGITSLKLAMTRAGKP
ncbi:MAG: hypothetical protein ABIK39_01295 [candidate division WOR-3 bacterium]